ncbi:hypothetical protein SNE40_007045 [Patella caerulea]|uniref:G-protein coupled receptors family 1 profile domain-containing protein n=1 Tax=Patella caerulea TaxID=87958 RepID=A0AAN8PT82_PATCE
MAAYNSTNRTETGSQQQPSDSQVSLIDRNLTAEAVHQLLLAQPDYRMSELLHTYLNPILMVLGIISNLLAIIVLRRKNLRNNSVCFYLAAYGVFNLLTLTVVHGTNWSCYIFETPCIGTLTDWSCGLWTFITHVIIYGGLWVVVAVSIDRFVYLCLPNKSLSLCTVFSAKVIVVFIVVGLVVISVHAMWTYQLQPQGCFIPHHQKDLHTLIWPWISATCYSYLPLALLLTLNICISIAMCLKKHRCRQMGRENEERVENNYITLIVSMLFFVLSMPATIINIIEIHFPLKWISIELVAQIELTNRITNILTIVNLAALGYVLLLFSKGFRDETYLILKGLGLVPKSKHCELREMSKYSDQLDRKHVEYEVCNMENSTTNV